MFLFVRQKASQASPRSFQISLFVAALLYPSLSQAGAYIEGPPMTTCEEVLERNGPPYPLMYPETVQCCADIGDFPYCVALYGLEVGSDTDRDGDGISDRTEIENGHDYTDPTDPFPSGNLYSYGDDDQDGLRNSEEIAFNTRIDMPDTDGDGLSDGDEVNNYGTLPRLPDTDGDGLDDPIELFMTFTDPRLPDSDGDGLSDGDEVNETLTNPHFEDVDGDGLTDPQEILLGTNPHNPDTDGGGRLDGDEIKMNPPRDPLIKEDDFLDGELAAVVTLGDEIILASNTSKIPYPQTTLSCPFPIPDPSARADTTWTNTIIPSYSAGTNYPLGESQDTVFQGGVGSLDLPYYSTQSLVDVLP